MTLHSHGTAGYVGDNHEIRCRAREFRARWRVRLHLSSRPFIAKDIPESSSNMAILEKFPIRLCRQMPFPSSTDDHKYAPLSGLDANLQDSSPIEDLVPNKSRRQRIIACLATAHTAFWFLISLAFFIAYVKKQPTDQQCVKQLNVYCKFVHLLTAI